MRGQGSEGKQRLSIRRKVLSDGIVLQVLKGHRAVSWHRVGRAEQQEETTCRQTQGERTTV